MDVEAVFVIGLMISFSTFGTALAFSAVGWWRSAKRARELENQLRRTVDTLNAGADALRLDARLESLETQLDRLAGGQEFLTRVMSDRRLLAPDGVPLHERSER